MCAECGADLRNEETSNNQGSRKKNFLNSHAIKRGRKARSLRIKTFLKLKKKVSTAIKLEVGGGVNPY